MALGVLEDFPYAENTISDIRPGAILVLGTDGVSETRNAENKMFGRKRLMKIVRKNAHRSAKAILEACVNALHDFRAGLAREDDETLVVIKAV